MLSPGGQKQHVLLLKLSRMGGAVSDPRKLECLWEPVSRESRDLLSQELATPRKDSPRSGCSGKKELSPVDLPGALHPSHNAVL